MQITTRLVLAVAFLACVLSANAAPAKKTPPPPTRGTIKSVDLKAMTVTLTLSPDSPPTTYAISPVCTIEINDKDSTPKQLKSGLFVRSVRTDSSTPPVALDLDVSTSGK